MSVLSKSIYNIVQRVDIIPRSVAPNELPKFVYEVPGIGPKLKEIEEKFLKGGSPRHGFECVGSYFALNPSHSGRKSIQLKLVDGPKLLNAFSTDAKAMAVAVLLDHSSDVTAEALIELCPSYKKKFNWGESRKIIGPSMPFPEMYRKKEKPVPVSNADQGKAESKDSLVKIIITNTITNNQLLSSLHYQDCKWVLLLSRQSLLQIPTMLRMLRVPPFIIPSSYFFNLTFNRNQTCLCLAYEFKCCKAYANEPGKWCLCQQAKCDCIVPTTCCKQVSQVYS
jgi:hypothetical protein